MSSSVNRLVYAPWGRLFEDVEMNGIGTASLPWHGNDQRQSAEMAGPEWNSSASIVAVSMTLQPKTLPAMTYAVTRIMSAISSAASIRLSTVVARRVAGVQVLANGDEPTTVPLVFYFPTAPSLTLEYKRRLVEADKNGYLREASMETFSFAQGTLETAILMNVTVPPKASTNETLDGDRENSDDSGGISLGAIIALASVGAVVATSLFIIMAILYIMPRAVQARERREALEEIRRNNSVRMGPFEARQGPSPETEV